MSKLRSPVRARLALAVTAVFSVIALPAQAQLTVGVANTKATLSGYVKLDALVNTRSDGAGAAAGGDGLLVPTTIPVGANHSSPGESKQATVHARESRFFLRTTTPSAMGEVLTHVEMDFFNGGLSGNEVVSNSHGLRLRHAYGSVGGFLAGQTWSNFMVPAALPESLDFGGGVAQTFIRQAQARYTTNVGGNAFSVALENPESNVSGVGPAGDDRLPDLTANLGFKAGKSQFWVTGLLRQLRVDTPALSDVTETGYGVSLYGVIPVGGKDSISFMAHGGKGIGRYFAGNLPDAFVAGSTIDAQNQYSGQIAYRHFWSNEWRSTIIASALVADNTNAIALANPTANKRFTSLHANLLYSPVPNVTTGVEYRWAKRETEGTNNLTGAAAAGSGINQTLQFSAKFGF